MASTVTEEASAVLKELTDPTRHDWSQVMCMIVGSR